MSEPIERAGGVMAWLLKAPIQVSLGLHRGGVAGWLDQERRIPFVYGEITGYFLAGLAGLMRGGASDPMVMQKMDAALNWLVRFSGNGAPLLTRHYLTPGGTDWRNQFCFSFDLAMMLRGVAMMPAANSSRESTMVALRQRLVSFIDENDRLRPAMPVNGCDPDPPRRWSTRRGPWQVKTAAAILSSLAPSSTGRLKHAAMNTIADWRHQDTPLLELHPYLYFLEGLLMAGLLCGDPGAWDDAGSGFRRVMACQRSDGGLPAARPGTSVPDRSDVVSQALRVGCILKALGRWQDEQGRLDALCRHLARFEGPEGDVFFYPPMPGERYRNVWNALFAFQALTFFGHLSAGNAQPREWIRDLI